jgi:hypothetical protein
MPTKRGGARLGAGRPAKFTIWQEWEIGGKVDNHINRRTLRHIHRLRIGAFYATPHGKVYKDYIADVNAVPDEYVAPPRAKREEQIELTKKFRKRIDRNKLSRHLTKIGMARDRGIKETVPPRPPAKTPDGFRDLAIRAMVRLLRRNGHTVPFKTVEDYLERFRMMQARIMAEPSDCPPNV